MKTEFRAVLSGMTVEELGRIEQARLDKVARDEAAEKDPRVAKADEMIGKLQWALTALGGTHNGYQEDRVESFRQTAHLGALLKRQLSNGATVYSAMKDAAALIRQDTIEAMVRLASWSALEPEIGASSMASARSLSMLRAISSFSLKDISLPESLPS